MPETSFTFPLSYTWNARNQVLQVTNLCGCGFLISDYQYSYNDAGLVERETAKECLFTSEKDYGHKGEKGSCVYKPSNPWGSQNPEWETTERSFAYDDNGQLICCEESKGRFDKVSYTYRYDEAGNRTFAKKEKRYSYLESWQNSYVYNDDNQMVSAEVCEGNLTKNYTFVYDANGNLTKECIKNKAEVTYQYDTENRLTAVYDPQKLLMAAVYDGDGNRAFQMNYDPDAKCGYGMNVSGEIFMPEHSQNEDESLTAEGTLFSYICSKTGRAYELTEYVNDINRQYTEVLSAYSINSGTDYESYSYAGDMRMSKNRFWNEARDLDYDQMSYYLYDGRGSVTANTWYNGMVTAVYRYDPYGQVSPGSTEHKDFYGYNGESYNPNTGLEYLRARYYNPNQGRFFQEDTYLGRITDPLSLNRYAYVKNSPLNYRDPSGHDAAAIAQTGFNVGANIANLDGGLPYADVGGAIVIVGYLLVAGGVYVGESISQAKKNKKTDGCQTEEKSDSELPENTTDAGKKGSKEWTKAKKKIKDSKGKGINTKTDSQEMAEKLLKEARPDLEKKPTYSKDGKSGYEVHPAEPEVGNTKPHIKWWDWSNGKSSGAEGHIYFD